MDQIQVHCPQCTKLYRVNVAELYPGEPRFQCIICFSKFGFAWPQPPGVSHVIVAQVVESPVLQESVLAPMAPQAIPLKSFDKPFKNPVSKRGSPVTPVSLTPANEDIAKAWEVVKADYASEAKHQEFIEKCLKSNSLPFASNVYRQVLSANPAESTARTMQDKILQFANATYLAELHRDKESRAIPRALTLLFGMGLLLILLGMVLPGMTSLIAVGVAVLVFGAVLRSLKQAV